MKFSECITKKSDNTSAYFSMKMLGLVTLRYETNLDKVIHCRRYATHCNRQNKFWTFHWKSKLTHFLFQFLSQLVLHFYAILPAIFASSFALVFAAIYGANFTVNFVTIVCSFCLKKRAKSLRVCCIIVSLKSRSMIQSVFTKNQLSDTYPLTDKKQSINSWENNFQSR